MIDYCGTQDVKAYIAASGTVDDALVANLIGIASRNIDDYTGRFFYGTVETRYYHAINDVYGRRLNLDEDLQGVVTITNGDDTTIGTADYKLLPYNDSPKYAIELLSSSGKAWTYQTDPDAAISVEGTWGFVAGTVPPEPIKQACVRYVQWMYAQRTAPFETRGLPDLPGVDVPSAMPRDVKLTLDRYTRHYIFSAGKRYDY